MNLEMIYANSAWRSKAKHKTFVGWGLPHAVDTDGKNSMGQAPSYMISAWLDVSTTDHHGAAVLLDGYDHRFAAFAPDFFDF